MFSNFGSQHLLHLVRNTAECALLNHQSAFQLSQTCCVEQNALNLIPFSKKIYVSFHQGIDQADQLNILYLKVFPISFLSIFSGSAQSKIQSCTFNITYSQYLVPSSLTDSRILTSVFALYDLKPRNFLQLRRYIQ